MAYQVAVDKYNDPIIKTDEGVYYGFLGYLTPLNLIKAERDQVIHIIETGAIDPFSENELEGAGFEDITDWEEL